jgi:hypothetical protein
MGAFEVDIGGKLYEIEAPDQGSALEAVRRMTGAGPRVDSSARDLAMGSDGVSGDSIRAGLAGDTRAQMRPEDIKAAYTMAQGRGDRPEQRAMAEAYVQQERANSPVMTGIGDRVRSVARGVPFVGEYLDEANARLRAPFDTKRREMALDYERARDRTFDDQNPIQSMAGKVTGGIAGTVAALPAAAATGTSALLGAGAKSVAGAIGRGTLAGVAQGAASGYGRADETQNAGQMAGRDALVGGAFGAAVPAALSAGKAGFDVLANKLAPSDILSSVPGKARDFFMRQAGDPAALARLQSEMQRLGPNAVLADASPEMQMIARGAAARPGSRAPIIEALSTRDQGKNQRLAEALRRDLGDVVEPSAIRDGIKANQKALAPVYEDALTNAKAVDTRALADSLDSQIVDARGGIRSSLEKARDMLNVYGTKELDPSPRAALQIRKSLDDMIEAAKRGGEKELVGALVPIRKSIDEALATSAPGIKSADAQFAELARQGKGLDDGASVFRSGPEAVRPADLSRQVAEQGVGTVGPSAVPFRMSQGARAEIDRIVGSNANDVAALRNQLKGEGDWNRDKLATLFGPEKASRILKVLDNEGQMEATYRAVVGGSPTAPTQGFKEFLDDAGKGTKVPADTTLTGLGINSLKKLAEFVLGSNSGAKAERFADDLGKLSVSGGQDADNIIAALMARQQRATGQAAFTDFAGRAGVGGARMDDKVPAKAAMLGILLAREKARNVVDDRAQSPRR